MLKIYCSSCGHPLQYESIKPKFCSSCGFQLDGKKIESKQKIVVSSENEEEDDEYYTSKVDISKIKSLQVEIDTNKRDAIQLKDIIGTNVGDDSWKKTKRQSGVKSKGKKQFQKEFHKIAGGISSKGNPIQIGG